MFRLSCDIASPAALDGIGPVLDFVAALPGVVAKRRCDGGLGAFAMVADDALGPEDAFLDGTTFARLTDEGDLEIALPERARVSAVGAGLARRAGEAGVVVEPPNGPLSSRALQDLVETSWAYARGL